MPYGLPVAAATCACSSIHDAVADGGTPNMPSAPAADTAAASRPSLTPAMGAPTSGTVSPNRSVNQVRGMVPPRSATAAPA
ncbi:hypothetical protein WBK31_15860 [Nonomuraea sp. N2-4H]